VCCTIGTLFPERISPKPVPASAPLNTFSSGRALRHLRQIAAVTHPAGTVENSRVAAYIASELSALGLYVEEQQTTVVSEPEDGEIVAARVRNLFARKAGLSSTGSLLLVAHYDSAVTSPGASDDGAAVAALLETARVLTATPSLKNDICFLFTDAEEPGLFGAKAFQSQHPAFQSVRAVLNFESRGTSGPSVIFETGPHSGWLVRQFITASRNAYGNSAAPAMYELLPNDTDFSVFRDVGVPGLNFAFIEDWPKYHTTLDSIANVDESSLQHHGLYATTLARRLGDADLRHMPGTNVVFFNLIGPWMLSYSAGWAMPLAVVVALIYIAAALSGIRRGRLSFRGVSIAAIVAPASVIVVGLLCKAYLTLVVGDIYEGFLLYRSGPYHWTFACLAALTVVTTFLAVLPRVGAYNVWMAVLLWWTLLALVTSWRMPGASYVFVWPALVNVVACCFTMRDSTANPTRQLASACTAAALSALVLVPISKMLGTALVLSDSYISGAFVSMCFLLLVPQTEAMVAPRRWIAPALLIIGVLAGSWLVRKTPVYDAAHPRNDRIVYAFNADRGAAAWVASEWGFDHWVGDVLAEGSRIRKPSEFLPAWYSAGFPRSRPLFSATAPNANLAPPSIEVLEDRTTEKRLIRLRVRSRRHAPKLAVRLEASGGVGLLSINGQPAAQSAPVSMTTAGKDRLPAPAQAMVVHFLGPGDDGLEIQFQAGPGPVHLQLLDHTYDLPAAAVRNIKPRPPFMTPTMSRGDGSVVVRSFNL
jgi:hypothetical protein